MSPILKFANTHATEHLIAVKRALASGLSVRPKTKVSKIKAPKDIILAGVVSREQILVRDAVNQGARVHFNPEDKGNVPVPVQSATLRQVIRQEAFDRSLFDRFLHETRLSVNTKRRITLGGKKRLPARA